MNEFYEVQLRHVWDDEEGWCEVGVYDTLAEAWFSYKDCIAHDVGQDYDEVRIIYYNDVVPSNHTIVVAYKRSE